THQPTRPSQPNRSERLPLAIAIETATRARPQRSESQPPIQTPAVPSPAISPAHCAPSEAASTSPRPWPTSTAARKAGSQAREMYSSQEWAPYARIVRRVGPFFSTSRLSRARRLGGGEIRQVAI